MERYELTQVEQALLLVLVAEEDLVGQVSDTEEMPAWEHLAGLEERRSSALEEIRRGSIGERTASWCMVLLYRTEGEASKQLQRRLLGVARPR